VTGRQRWRRGVPLADPGQQHWTAGHIAEPRRSEMLRDVRADVLAVPALRDGDVVRGVGLGESAVPSRREPARRRPSKAEDVVPTTVSNIREHRQ